MFNSNEKHRHSVGQIKQLQERLGCLLSVTASDVKPQGDLASYVTSQPPSLEFILKSKGDL